MNPSKWLNSVLSNIGSHHVNKLNELLPTVANF
ncbi:MAG: hypothetical protein KAG96_02200 [Ichthyobacteriaceae bacterium]|nr:hypothetical protein [Ichthyobacteriaceae bacterium]